jgi:hypothetical protein
LTLGVGESSTCTINNDDGTATLTLAKTVTNENGGTAAITEWTLSAAGPTPISGASGDEAITDAAVDAGDYTLAEADGPDGYTAGTWICSAGTLVGDTVTLVVGETAICTINNHDDPAALTLVKTVTNDNGGTAVATDWTLSAVGPTSISGVSGDTSISDAAVDAGDYTLAEADGPDDYTASDWSCTAGTLLGDRLTLALGESAVCTITNDDSALLPMIPVPVNDKLSLLLLTLLMFASGLYYRRTVIRRP